MTNKEPINILFKKYLSGTITPDELKVLLCYVANAKEGDGLSRYIQQEVAKEVDPTDSPLIDEIVNHVEHRLFDQVFSEEPANVREFPRPGRTKRLFWSWAVAAVVLATFAFSLNLWYQKQGDTVESTDILAIGPGGNRATLTLVNGQVVDLKEDQMGIVVGDQLQYLDGTEILTDRTGTRGDAEEYVMTTPRGGMYSVVLPDGSRVWLNAVSTLKYPNKFHGSERLVELEGEGFFEVTDDQERPFLVRSRGQVIKVLGTAFNVNAYPEEEQIVTTLVEGSVSIHTANTHQGERKANESPFLLKPGQQARYSEKEVEVLEVSTSDFIAWRNGTFAFYGQSMPVVMRQIERWYDVSFENIALTENIELWGALSRDVMLSQILEVIELNTTLGFKQQERRITIYSKNDQ